MLKAAGYARPLVALTANIISEDLQRYSAAGFARSIGKPIDFALLGATIAELLGQTPATDAVAASDAVAAIDGLAEIRAAFSDSLAPRLASLAALVQAADWLEAASVAHQLRGAGGSFGYPGLSRCARLIEQAAEAGDSAAARAATAEMMGLDELRPILHQYAQ